MQLYLKILLQLLIIGRRDLKGFVVDPTHNSSKETPEASSEEEERE
jgi:hypothetical protein